MRRWISQNNIRLPRGAFFIVIPKPPPREVVIEPVRL
ncbi:hypothetical protein KRK78_004869 [Escherichia coli]|nr:hypothetical protein [Escherichia coli]EHQ4302674.1 hypothetical protein [Escherichia coli]EHQ4349916.1 hypothetical protein [Escherichia coli]EHQ4364856.1 hypothetical protein [Escherichia coli]EHQ4374773.1 hypothetical protein [Escherichia coli]